MQYEDTIEIRGVTVMRQTDRELLCRMGNQDRWIAPAQLRPGSSMNDPLAGGTGDRVTFPEVPMAGEAVPPFPVPGGEHGRVVLSAPRQGRHLDAARHEPGVTFTDRYSLLRERIVDLLGSRLLLLGTLVAPLVMAGYVALTVLLFLPLLGLRRIFPRRSTSSLVRRDGSARLDSGVGTLWDAETGSA
jgi:hypothetical protein